MTESRHVLLHLDDGSPWSVPIARIIEVRAPHPDIVRTLKERFNGVAGGQVVTLPLQAEGRYSSLGETLVMESPEVVRDAINAVLAGKHQPAFRYFIKGTPAPAPASTDTEAIAPLELRFGPRRFDYQPGPEVQVGAWGVWCGCDDDFMQCIPGEPIRGRCAATKFDSKAAAQAAADTCNAVVLSGGPLVYPKK